jgi:hypothetical protein
MFWGVSDRFVTARSRCKTSKTSAINAKVRKTMLRRNFLHRTHRIHSIGPKTHVLGCFGPFCYYTKVDAKLAEMAPLTHKFAKPSHVRIFRNERTRSTLLDPKLIFWDVQNFSQRTHPIHYIGPKLMFWGVSDRFVAARKSMQNWPNSCH